MLVMQERLFLNFWSKMIKKRKLLLILYQGREASSAIINGLQHSNQVYVPVFEDFDEYLFGSKFPGEDIGQVLLYIEEVKDSKQQFNKFNKNFISDDYVICFKWRKWGDVRILEKLSEKYDLHIIILVRRFAFKHSIRDLSSKLIYDKLPPDMQVVIGEDLHLQFLKDRSDYVRFLKEINETRVRIPLERLREHTSHYCNYKKQLLEDFSKVKSKASGMILFFEDYSNDEIKVHEEIAKFIKINKYNITREYFKTEIKISQIVENFNDLLIDPETLSINADYLHAIESYSL